MSWFKEAVTRDLLPLFPRAVLSDYSGTETARVLVAYDETNTALKFCSVGATNYELRLARPTAFRTEFQDLLKLYCECISKAHSEWRGPLIEVSGLALRRVVAKTVMPTAEDTAVLALDYLSSYSEETYEGRRIAGAVVIDGSRLGSGPDLKEIFALPCSHVLSDGIDSWLTVGSDGKLFTSSGAVAAVTAVCFFPYRYAGLAGLTLHAQTAAMALNRSGEILVFSRGSLTFAKRRGTWRYFDHAEFVSAVSTGGNNPVVNRQALYVSCIDASFARCGACCAIIPNNAITSSAFRLLVSADDRVDTPVSTKSKLLSQLIDGRLFKDLPRHLRRELLSIDGSTIVSASGRVLAVGAIVKVGSGSSGGGRKAAAVALSAMGVGIKVSADGKISVFRGAVPDPLFEMG